MAISFRGQYPHTIDAKGRTSLPSRFRDQLQQAEQSRLVLAPALFFDCIDVHPLCAWEQFEAKVAALPQFDPDVMRLRRLYVSAAVDCELDKLGRLLVPPMLREHAGLSKQVLWAGVTEKAELWDMDRWKAVTQSTAQDLAKLQERMAEWRL